MPLSGMWFPSVGTFGIVLAVTGSFVSLLALTAWKRISLALLFILLGVGEIVSIHRADIAHTTDVGAQQKDIENLTRELQKSEMQRQVENAILRTKLEDYATWSHLGPALMKLAQTSAEFQKKQYETKVMNDRDLYDLTMKAVRKIRDFSTKYAELELRRQQARLSFTPGSVSDIDRQKRFSDDISQSFQISHAKYSEFQTSILPDVCSQGSIQKFPWRFTWNCGLSPWLGGDGFFGLTQYELFHIPDNFRSSRPRFS